MHTFIFWRFPSPIRARTVWIFGFQRRLVRRCECETAIPKPGPLAQTSQTAAIVVELLEIEHQGSDAERTLIVGAEKQLRLIMLGMGQWKPDLK